MDGKIVSTEGMGGLYKGLVPLWCRQIPYTMVKFASFENIVAGIYKYLGKPKDSFTTLQQTGVSFWVVILQVSSVLLFLILLMLWLVKLILKNSKRINW